MTSFLSELRHGVGFQGVELLLTSDAVLSACSSSFVPDDSVADLAVSHAWRNVRPNLAGVPAVRASDAPAAFSVEPTMRIAPLNPSVRVD